MENFYKIKIDKDIDSQLEKATLERKKFKTECLAYNSFSPLENLEKEAKAYRAFFGQAKMPKQSLVH